jgi:hypothetical protein
MQKATLSLSLETIQCFAFPILSGEYEITVPIEWGNSLVLQLDTTAGSVKISHPAAQAGNGASFPENRHRHSTNSVGSDFGIGAEALRNLHRSE